MQELVILGLVTWRISALLVEEEGPLDVFSRLRNWIGVQYDQFSNPYGEYFLAKLFACIRCMSVWVAFFACIAGSSSPMDLLFRTMAVSAVAIVVDAVVGLGTHATSDIFRGER